MERVGPDEADQAIGGKSTEDDGLQLKGEIDEEQQMIGHLDALSKAHKQGMEDYTLRLAKMKPRLLRGRGKGRGRYRQRDLSPPKVVTLLSSSEIEPSKDDEATETAWPVETIDLPPKLMGQKVTEESDSAVLVATPEVPKADSSRSKVLLLRKQLEENRVKFDRQQKENSDKKIALANMMDRVEQLGVEIENRDHLIESLQQGDTSRANPDTHILYRQIIYKDNTILDLTETVSQLEMQIQDQREQLAEKDHVIAARTEAVSLVAKDRDQKLQKTVDELEETNLTMREMKKQSDSNISQWQMNEKILNGLISKKDANICVLEENAKRSESVRFQLSVRNAELQDKLVSVQTDMQVINSKLKLAENKLIEKSEEISDLKKQVNRAEAFGQKKLKAFEKHFKSVEQDDLGERILMLTNDIALIEEEKGNLQLKLVDCDDVSVTNEKLSSENIHLEAKYENLSLELKSVSDFVADLEKEKILLVESLNENNLLKNTTEDQLAAKVQELEDAKRNIVVFEKSALRLQEERDLAVGKLEKLQTEDKINDVLIKDKDELQQQLSDRETDLDGLRAILAKQQEEHDRQVEIAKVAVESKERKQQEGNSLLQLLTDKEEFITLQSIELSSSQEVVIELENKLTTIHETEHGYETEIESLKEEICEDERAIEQCRKQLNLLQSEFSRSKQDNLLLKDSINELNLKLKDRIQFASSLQDAIAKMEDKLNSANYTIESNSKELQNRANKIEELMEEVAFVNVKYTDLKGDFVSYEETTKSTAAQLKCELNVLSALISDKDNQLASLKLDVQIKEDQMKNNEIMISKFEQENCENNRKIDELTNTNATLQIELNMQSALISDKDNIISTLNSDLEIKEEQINNNQIMITNFENENCVNNRKIDDLIDQSEKSESDIKLLNDKIEEYDSSIEKYIQEITGLHELIAERDSSILNLKMNFDSSSSQTSQLYANLEETQQACLSLQKDNEELRTQMASINLKSYETSAEFESIKMKYENEIVLLRQDIVDKQAQISYVENQIEVTKEEMTAERDALMTDSSQQLTALQKNTYDLGSKMSDLNEQLNEKEIEIDSLKTNLNEYTIKYSEEVSDKLIMNYEEIGLLTGQLADKNKHCQDLMNGMIKTESEKEELVGKINELTLKLSSAESEKEELVGKIDEITLKLSSAESEKEELVGKIDELTLKLRSAESSYLILNEELVSLQLSQAASKATETSPVLHVSPDSVEISELREECENISQEKLKIEGDLFEAQQAIIRLETSLATQTPQEENAKGGWSDWGDVDLGHKNEVDPPFRTTLLEKDRVLTMTQEQLKDALEQVNTVVDEKKLTEQQMKVLEAELNHKQEKIDSHMEEIQFLKVSMTELEDRCLEMQQPSYDGQGQLVATTVESAVTEIKTEAEEIQATSFHDIQTYEDTPGIESTTPASEIPIEVTDGSESSPSVEEVRFKLTWYEEMWPQWSESYNQMCIAYESAQEQISLLQNQLNDAETKLQETVEIKTPVTLIEDSWKDSPAYVEHEREMKTLRSQTVELECSIAELKSECEKLRPFEALCSQMRTNVQEFEAKRDGTNARISELELMVQSAESEISRLRSDMQSLTNAGNSLETERSCLKEEITNLKEEIRKNNTERERLAEESTKLQQQAATQLSSTAELEYSNQRFSSENMQLRSEIEVMEGDAERARVGWQFSETENNRLRADNDLLTQNGHVLEAEKESLAHELQRISNQMEGLTSERDHLKGEAERQLELSISAESEIARLKVHLESMNDLTTRYQQLENQYSNLQTKMVEMEDANNSRRSLTGDEIDWSAEGNLEAEHFQTSQQSEEIKLLNEQIRQLEKKKNSLDDELYAAKLKNGKMIQKLKTANTKVENLQKELEKLRPQGLSDLDAAMEAEWKAQVFKAESARDEYKIKADELEKEKKNLVGQIDVLHSAQEKYLELKENQDWNQQQVSNRNKSLESEISSMEWRIAELVEALEEKAAEEQSEDVPALVNRITELEKVLKDLSLEKAQTNMEKEQIQGKLEEAEIECNKMQLMLSEMKEIKQRIEGDCEKYKTTYLELHSEHENLLETEKKSTGKLNVVEHELNTLKYSYDSIYNTYNNLQLDRDAVKYDLGIMAGEKEKLQEELNSLHNIQDALKEEEQETVIISLQEECALQRQQNNELKDEIIILGESARQSEEESVRAKHTLEQQLDIQELIRIELNERMMEINYLNGAHQTNEKEIKYANAEAAALKSQAAQLQETLDNTRSQVAELQAKLELLQQPGAPLKETDDPSVQQQTSTQSEVSSGTDADIPTHLLELRCRQLSLEINRLLEERDALQLKLSSTLRQNQELGRELSLSQQLPTPPPPNALKKKLAELRELNSSLEEKTVMSSLSVLPPSAPTFVSRTAPPTPTASRHRDLNIVRDTQGSSGIVGWILGRGPEKEVLHV